MPRRRGRPGLVGTMARTAVIAGTATAVSGSMTRHAQEEAQDQAAQQAAFEAQAELADLQAQLTAQQEAPTAGGGDLTAELEKLAGMKASGMLSDEEFAAAKAKLLSG